MFIDLAVGSLEIANSLPSHRSLTYDIAGHFASQAVINTTLRYVRGKKRRGLSRRQMRKMAHRQRRYFVDNIIMHHKRLHDKNRETIVKNARDRILQKKKEKEKTLLQQQVQPTKWRDREDIKSKCLTIRGRIGDRKVRARSRWVTVVEKSRMAG